VIARRRWSVSKQRKIPSARNRFGRICVGEAVPMFIKGLRPSGQVSHDFQQPWSTVCAPTLAPMASSAAVGFPCICLCASCAEVALLPAARFMVSVGG
jgi:hypothetical protein